MVEVLDLDQARAWKAAAAVLDPEVPAVTVADLGILRSVEVRDGVATAKVTPTYSGCPAVLAIELAVESALLDAGLRRRSNVFSPRPGRPTGSLKKGAKSCAPMALRRR